MRTLLYAVLLLAGTARAATPQPASTDDAPRPSLRLLEPIPEHAPTYQSTRPPTPLPPHGDYDASRHLYLRTYGPAYYAPYGCFYSWGWGWYYPRYAWPIVIPY